MRDCVVDTGLRTDVQTWLESRQEKDVFSLSKNLKIRHGDHQTFCLRVTGGSSSRVKQPKREADYSPPPSADVKNKWIYTTDPVCLHCVYRENFSLLCLHRQETCIQPFKDEAYLFYIRTQCVPRCKHSPLRL
jgi:hypothetical protein